MNPEGSRLLFRRPDRFGDPTRQQRVQQRVQPPTRPGPRWWAICVLAVIIAQLISPSTTPPLYDGVGFPDEPYRWVSPPPDAPKTAPPTVASLQVTTGADGLSAASRGFSAEQGPQVAIAIAQGALRAGPSDQITIEAQPQAAPAAPDGVSVVSDLYHLKVTARSGAAVTLQSGATLLVNLRAGAATDLRVLVATWDGRTWTEVGTTQVGTEIYAASLVGLSDFALFRLQPGVAPTLASSIAPPNAGSLGAGGPSSSASTAASTSAFWLWAGVLIPFAVLGIAVFMIRRRPSPKGPRRIEKRLDQDETW